MSPTKSLPPTLLFILLYCLPRSGSVFLLIFFDCLPRSGSHFTKPFCRAHLLKLIDYCATGVNEGARLVLGGKRADMPGLYFEPTIFTDVKDDMFIAKEESFGPVMIISTFENECVF